MNKKNIWAIILIVVGIFAYLYLSPYLVLNKIKHAAQAGQSEKVSQYIDYPSVRQSFKDQMNRKLMQTASEQRDNGTTTLGAMFASSMLEKMLDLVVTPTGMTLLLQGRDFKDAVLGQKLETQIQTSPGTLEMKSVEITSVAAPVTYTAGYTAFNHFDVVIKDINSAQTIQVRMLRDGLSWKISEIVIPMN